MQDLKVGDHVWIWGPWFRGLENPPVEAIVDKVSDQGCDVHAVKDPQTILANYKGYLYRSRQEAGEQFCHWVNRFIGHIEIELHFCQEGPSFQVNDQVWVWDRWYEGIYEVPWEGTIKEVSPSGEYVIYREGNREDFHRPYLSIFSTQEEATNVYLFKGRQYRSELEKRRQEWQEALNQWKKEIENVEDSRLGGTT